MKQTQYIRTTLGDFIQNILCDSDLTKLTKAVHNLADEVTSDHIDKNVNNILLSAAKKSLIKKRLKGLKEGKRSLV